ncbi:CaiB/BaiF CoA transferase family protein, partial [Chloroflexota bacterium]
GTMEKLGLGYNDLIKSNPSIIMVSASFDGANLPGSDIAAVGNLMQAKAGYHHFTGWPDRPPVPPSAAIPDFITPFYIVITLMAALDYRHRTGKGQHINVSMHQSSLQFMSPALMDYIVNDRIQVRKGNLSDHAAPHGVYRCKGDDAWCAIAVTRDEEWLALCQEMGNPPWTKDPKFQTMPRRLEAEQKVDRHIEAWTSQYSPYEVMQRLQAAEVPAGVVATGKDLDEDPHLKAIHHYPELSHPEMGRHKYEAPAIRLSETPAEIRRAPCLGEDTFFVCTELLGMSAQEFVELDSEGVFGREHQGKIQ